MDPKKKSFLISAYACEPGEGSEPGVGWNWAVELANVHNVVVITRSNNRKAIESVYSKEKHSNLSFIYCDVPKVLSFWKKGQKGLHLYYFLWQIVCYSIAKKNCRENIFDYSMTLTFGNMWLPTFMYKLPCEFIWGPLGGGEGVPKILWPNLSRKHVLLEKVRVINGVFPITNPWFFTICRKSKIIIVRTKDSLKCIPKKYWDKCELIIETGINKSDIDVFMKYKNVSVDGVRSNDLIICGRLIPLKMVDMAVDTMEQVTQNVGDIRLHIVGDGVEKEKITRKIADKHLEKHVIMHGRKSHEETLAIMSACKALLMTSSHEGGSWVMFEAMLLRKPIICFDTSGMSVVVTPETGYLIPVCSYDEAVVLFAKAITDMLNDSGIENKKENAYLRVTQEFLWSTKIEKMCKRLGLQQSNFCNFG